MTWIVYKCTNHSGSTCLEYTQNMPIENFNSLKEFAADSNNALQISFLIFIWSWVMYLLIKFYKKMIAKL